MQILSLILSFLFVASVGCSELSVDILHNNNTGPESRSSPVLLCYPPPVSTNSSFYKCYVAGGLTFPFAFFPTKFHRDIWEMTVDLSTKSVSWRNMTFTDPPIEAKGGFHRYWRHNSTAFSFTGGLNSFDPQASPPNATCTGNRIVTYDFVSETWEVTTPEGFAWENVAGGACYRLNNGSVFCWGGFGCGNFTDVKAWTRYDIPTNTLSFVNSDGLDTMIARHHSTVECIEEEDSCIIGSGDRFGGGTIDQWSWFIISENFFTHFDPVAKPVGIQYIESKVAQVWNLTDNDYQVVLNLNKHLITGGDQASGASGTSNTVRILKELKRHPAPRFKDFDADDLFTVKQERLSVLPSLSLNNPAAMWIEFGGFSQNANTTLNYPNQAVLYTMTEDDDD